MRQYWDIKTKYLDMILFFRLGDFYEMFYDDAIKSAPILDVVLTQRSGTPMCGIPYHSANSYIRKLITNGFKVAICEQLEKSNNGTTANSIVKRGVIKVITPGMVLEDTILDSKKNNFLMALTLDKTLTTVAFAVADISTGDFFTSQTSLNFIETEVLKYNPGELIILSKDMQNECINHLISKIKILVSNVNDINLVNAKKIIFEVFNDKNTKKIEFFSEGIIRVCGMLISYIKEMQPGSINIFLNMNIRYIKNSDFMYLDIVTIKNLELFNSNTGKSENSLLSVIDSTKTSMGARLMRRWLMRPLLDFSKIEKRQNAVKFFIRNLSIRKEVVSKLKNISDIERIIARISSNNTNPRDLIALKNSLNAINDISKIIGYSSELSIDIPNNAEVIDNISSHLFDDPSISLKYGNVIRNGVSYELDELRKICTNTKNYMSDLESKEKNQTKINNLKIGYTSTFGYYIEVTKSNIKLVPKHYTRKQTVVNGERYITEELKILEGEILSAQIKILNLENSIFNDLREKISVFSSNVLKTSQIIAEIDILCSFAINALEYDYVCPDVSQYSEEFSIKNGRHPVVENMLKTGEFVANDIFMNKDAKIMILTGPNMSGKSTYLRQIALITIMAQIGSFVPARSAQIGVIDRIFTRIGAGDNLAGGKSTFMVEMTETANILNQYTKGSLIVLDEIGRGTSTYDGISIAWAIIEYFAKNTEANSGVKVLFATHYFELTSLKKTLKCVVNYSVSIKEWNNEVVFLYKIIKGSINKSYGIYVAKIAGIPASIIKRAYEILDKLEINQANKKLQRKKWN